MLSHLPIGSSIGSICTLRAMRSPASISTLQPDVHTSENAPNSKSYSRGIRRIIMILLRIRRWVRSFLSSLFALLIWRISSADPPDSHRLFLVVHRPWDGLVQGILQGGHGLDETGPISRMQESFRYILNRPKSNALSRIRSNQRKYAAKGNSNRIRPRKTTMEGELAAGCAG